MLRCMSYTQVCIDFKQSIHHLKDIEQLFSKAELLGVQDFSLDESQVDSLLGERAYSGGEIPIEVLEEIEMAMGDVKKTYFFNKLDKEVTSQLSQFAGIEYQITQMEAKDWNEEWKKFYNKIEISNKLAIVPSWHSGQKISDVELKIYPGMGFGTGTHETTFLCLKLLDEILSRGRPLTTALDFGCGSGILGIAFKLLGGREVDFVDIDINALENTKQNLKLNTLREDDKLRLFTSFEKGKLKNEYELIFANILQNVLFTERAFFSSSLGSGSLLILSGLLNEQVSETVAFYEKSQDLECLKLISKGDWSAILLRKK